MSRPLCKVEVYDDHTEITLPSGKKVVGYPQGSAHQAEVAQRLGYGTDVLAMVLEHDPLHAKLCDWLGFTSYSLRQTAGELSNEEAYLAEAEEEAVIAVQRFARLAKRNNR